MEKTTGTNPISNCEEIEKLLSPYLDGELDSSKTALVFEHLHSCTSCKESLKVMENWKKALQTVFQEAPKGTFLSQRILHSIRKEKKTQQSKRKISYSLHAAMAICATLLIFGLLSFWVFPPIHSVSQNQKIIGRVSLPVGVSY
ncbi:MAG: hypothetical protein D6785_02890, partial [Planctomycetota bacterium]